MSQELRTTSTRADSTGRKVEFPPYFAWVLGLAVLGLNFFAYSVGFGLGVGLFHLCLVWATVLAFPEKNRRPLMYLLTLIGSLAGVLIGFRANGFVQAVNLVTIWLVFIALFVLRSAARIRWQVWELTKSLKDFLFRLPHQIAWLAEYSSRPEAGKVRLLAIVKSAIITFVVLLFFVSLLASADPIFAEIVGKFRGEAVGRIITSLLLTLALTVLLTNKIKSDEVRPPELKFLSFQDIVISITGLLLLFAFFLVIQAKYLFASHADFQSFNLTYSGYVRKGFFELILATFFASLIAYLVILKQRVVKTAKRVIWLKLINIALMGELICLLISALKRDLMYIEVYALTRTRIIGEVFLAWVAGLLLLLFLLNTWRKFKELQFLAGLGLASLLVIGFLNIFNMDQHIAQAVPNRHRQKVDLFYISILSEDACQGWGESIVQAQEIFATFEDKAELNAEEQSQLANLKLAMIALQEKREKLARKYGDEKTARGSLVKDESSLGVISELPGWLQKERRWQAFNLSQYLAYQTMQTSKELFYDRVDQLIEAIAIYQKTNHINLFNTELWILREFEYPFVNVNLRYSPANSILEEEKSSLPRLPSTDRSLSPIQDRD